MIRALPGGNAPPPGGSWRVRRLDAGGTARDAVLRHLRALDADDRYLRFGHTASDATLAAYVAGLDFARDGILAVGAGTPSRGVLIGLAHVALQPPQAEFGLSVLPAWRRRGIGRRLFVATMACAAGEGLAALACMTGNASVLNMARELSFSIRLGAGEACATIALSGAPADERRVREAWETRDERGARSERAERGAA